MSTTPSPQPRRRWPTVLAVAAAVLAVVVVVWLLVVDQLLGDDAGSGAAPTTEPTVTAAPSGEPTGGEEPAATEEPAAAPSPEPSEDGSAPEPATSAPAGGTEQVRLWFIGEHEETTQGPSLYPEQTAVEVPAGATPAQAAVTALLAAEPVDPDYGNAFWDPAAQPADRTPATAMVTEGADGTTIDVSGDAFDVGVGSAYAELGVQQLVSTALTNGATAPVEVTVDGASGAEVWGVIALEPAYELDEQVWTSASITTPAHGATVSSPVTVSGVGFGFEGELDVLVLDEATGDVVEQTFVMTSEGATLTEDGMPVRSAYSIDLELDPGTYRIVVADADESGEGSRWVSYDDRVVTVG